MDIRDFFNRPTKPVAKPIKTLSKPETDWRLSHKLYLNEGVMNYEFFNDYLKSYAPSALKKIMEKEKDDLVEYYSFTWKDGYNTYAEIWFINEIPTIVSNISGSSSYAGNTCDMHREYADDEIGDGEYQHQVEYTIDEICSGGKKTRPFAPKYKIRKLLLKQIGNIKKYEK